jgi:TPR repeat protein
MLAQIGAVGFPADIEQARKWYQKAASLGAAEATRRLQVLANR